MNRLLPCPQCNRHRHACEPVCPFCGVTLPACSAVSAKNAPGRVSRAVLVAAGAALVGGAACSAIPLYGVPPDGSTDAGSARAAAVNTNDERHADADAPDGGER
jgi:hypothetical protein